MAGRAGLVTLLLLAAAAAALASPASSGEGLALNPRAVRKLLSDRVNCAAKATYRAATGQTCIDDELKQGTVCAAGEVQILGASFEGTVDAASGAGLPTQACCGGGRCSVCEQGQRLIGTLVLTVRSNAERYSAGLWVAEAGQAACARAGSKAQCPGNLCTKRAFAPVAPFVNYDDADVDEACCGDLPKAAAITVRIPDFPLSCELAAAPASACGNAGSQNLDWCFGWGQNRDKDTCFVTTSGSGASSFPAWATRPGTPAKCSCGVSSIGGLEVFVPTCGRPRVDGSTAGFSCATGQEPDTSKANITFSNYAGQCCRPSAAPFTPTCGRPDAATAGVYPCSAADGLSYNQSAAAVTPPSPAACCIFTPTCFKQNADTPGEFPWTCPTGLGPDSSASNLTFNSTNYDAVCCPIQEGGGSPEVSLSASASITLPAVNTFTWVNFTTASIGTDAAPNVQLSLTIPAGLTFLDEWTCSSPDAVCGPFSPEPPGTPSSGGGVACSLGAMTAGTAIVCSFRVSPTQPRPQNFTVDGRVDIFDAANENIVPDNADDNSASVTVAALKCPSFQRPAADGSRCETLSCDPCAVAAPTVYLTTGSGGAPPSGLWRVQNFTVGGNAQRAEFLCIITGLSTTPRTAFPGDVAVMWNGDLVILDTNGWLYTVAASSLPAPSDPALATANRRYCPARALYKVPPTGADSSFTGLSNGLRSDELYLSTGGGFVRNLRLTEEQGVQEAPTSISASCSSRRQKANSGGTDITFGPDKQLYRLCAADQQDGGQEYTGTRFAVNALGLTGERAWTNEGLANSAGMVLGQFAVANAAAFCTSSRVVGVGALNGDGSISSFVDFGFGSPTSQTVLGAATPLARMRQVGQAFNAVGARRANQMRVTGAGSQPTCTQALP